MRLLGSSVRYMPPRLIDLPSGLWSSIQSGVSPSSSERLVELLLAKNSLIRTEELTTERVTTASIARPDRSVLRTLKERFDPRFGSDDAVLRVLPLIVKSALFVSPVPATSW